MKIVHEKLLEEALQIADVLNEVFELENELLETDLESVFKPISEFTGYWPSSEELARALNPDKKASLVLTQRDIYAGNQSKEDDWVFGYSIGNLAVVSTARMKRYDSRSSEELQIPFEKYIKRPKVMSIHEVGHRIIHGDHLKEATWVNSKTNYKLHLGKHCTDNSCSMYEVVDIRAPSKNEGYMQLGEKKRYDAGLDDVIERLHPKWLCDMCRNSVNFDKQVYN